MTAPSGTNLPVGQFPGIATNPDGTPNFGGAAPAPGGGPSGQQNIWNLPKGLPAQLWFDVGHNSTGDQPNEDRGGLHPGHLKAPNRSSAYQILKSPTQIMAQFAAMSANNPNEYLALQQALGVQLTGSWNATTKNALANAMQSYVELSLGAGVGMSFKDYLIQKGTEAQQLGLKNSGAQAAQQIQVTDPTAIKAAAQSAFQAATGKGASEDQLNKFVAQFQAAQSSAQTQVGGTISAPDLSSQAMSYAQTADPGAYKDNQRQSFIDTLVNMFAPSGSQRPNMTPVPSVGG